MLQKCHIRNKYFKRNVHRISQKCWFEKKKKRWKSHFDKYLKKTANGVQAVRRSSSAEVPSSHLCHSIWVSWRAKQSLGWFRGFSRFPPFSPLLQISFHHFSTLVHFISLHFICPCDDLSSVIGWHPCYSQTFNKRASSQLIPRLGPMSDTTWYFLS